jgi:hypothetical protein
MWWIIVETSDFSLESLLIPGELCAMQVRFCWLSCKTMITQFMAVRLAMAGPVE